VPDADKKLSNDITNMDFTGKKLNEYDDYDNHRMIMHDRRLKKIKELV